jgi:hypothetical protein
MCGHDLPESLNDGLTHCCHCSQVVDSSEMNVLLSAAWMVRKNRYSQEQLKCNCKLDPDLALLVHSFVSENGYSHEEFLRVLKKLGVANKSYIKFGTK